MQQPEISAPIDAYELSRRGAMAILVILAIAAIDYGIDTAEPTHRVVAIAYGACSLATIIRELLRPTTIGANLKALGIILLPLVALANLETIQKDVVDALPIFGCVIGLIFWGNSLQRDATRVDVIEHHRQTSESNPQ